MLATKPTQVLQPPCTSRTTSISTHTGLLAAHHAGILMVTAPRVPSYLSCVDPNYQHGTPLVTSILGHCNLCQSSTCGALHLGTLDR
ncbi:Hypothetical predicted protein, partial [Marmota monax]